MLSAPNPYCFLSYKLLSLSQVQIIGDAYMAMDTSHHVEDITNFAFNIVKATAKINDPSTNNPLSIRVGKVMGTRLQRIGCY